MSSNKIVIRRYKSTSRDSLQISFFSLLLLHLYLSTIINTLLNNLILFDLFDLCLYLILRIDKQKYFDISNVELSDVAKLNRLKKKFFSILIILNILSVLSIYKSLQYKLRKSLSYISNICKRLINYFRLLEIARHSCIIAIHINLNVLKHRIIELLEKQSCSRLCRNINKLEIDVIITILLAIEYIKLD